MPTYFNLSSGKYLSDQYAGMLEDDLDLKIIARVRRHSPEQNPTQNSNAAIYICIQTKDGMIVQPGVTTVITPQQATGAYNLFGEGIPFAMIQMTGGTIIDPHPDLDDDEPSGPSFDGPTDPSNPK